ncbi:MAG: phosphopentomutase [Bacilli bacterium]|jgi:phosphopentomutase
MNKYKRFFIIVIDSVGIGEMPDADKFGDKGANTLVHTARAVGGLNVPVMDSLGLGNLAPILGTSLVEHPHSYALRLRETSAGKDTMTGHWEMMGINTTKPFQTFTDTAFSQSLIDELEEKTGHEIIGNKAASGTEILVELGEQQMRENSLIVYTSADSVLQIAAHEETTGVAELYRCCDIAREICMKPEYFVGRIIARPFVGTNKSNFKRTANRHDLAVSPTGITALDILKDNGFMVSAIGKINDIFNTVGVVKTQKTVSNLDGMKKTIAEAKNHDFDGICYVNLVEFDSEYGHRRNSRGYAKALEEFDEQLGELIKVIKDDDIVMVTADHGNDPTHRGTDHTREKVPLLIYSKSMKKGRYLDERDTFAVIGATILKNFGLKKTPNQIGEPIMEIFE